MHRFNSPPSWPEPPTATWRPPLGWKPDPEWPDAPADWGFWLNRHGRPAIGPIGAYGAVDAGRSDVATVDRSVLLMHG